MRPSVDVGIVHTDEFRHGEVSNAELEKLLKRAESESETDAAFEAGLNDAIVTVLDANQSFYLEEDGDGKEESVSLAELLFELPPSSAVDDLLSEAETETLSPEELKMIERSVPTVALYQRMRQVNQCMPKVPNPMNPIREGTYSASWTMLLEEKDGKRFRNKLNKYVLNCCVEWKCVLMQNTITGMVFGISATIWEYSSLKCTCLLAGGFMSKVIRSNAIVMSRMSGSWKTTSARPEDSGD